MQASNQFPQVALFVVDLLTFTLSQTQQPTRKKINSKWEADHCVYPEVLFDTNSNGSIEWEGPLTVLGGNRKSVTQSQAVASRKAGKLHTCVSCRRPKWAKDWLDTGGRAKGTLVFSLVLPEGAMPTPGCTLVQLD